MLFPSRCSWCQHAPGRCTAAFPRLSCTRLVSRSPVRPVTLSLLFSSHSESPRVSSLPDRARQSRLGCTSDLPQPSFGEPFSRSFCQERKLDHFPYVPRSHLYFIRQKVQPISKFRCSGQQQTVINMNENSDVQHIISETYRICLSRVDGHSDSPGVFQRVGTTVSVQCDNHTMLCSVSKLRLRTILTHTIRLIRVALQTVLGQCLCAGKLCVRRLQLCCNRVLDGLFDHMNLQPTLFSETVSMVSVHTSPSEPAWTSHERLFLDHPSRLETSSDRFIVVMAPISFSEFSSF